MSVREDTIHGIKWNTINRYSETLITFGVGVVLARLLSPSDYGMVGMTALFFTISYIFIDGGFGSALIREKNLTQEDCSTVFFFNVAMSCLIYIFLFLTAPFIATFLGYEILTELIRVSGLSMVIGSLGSVHFTLLKKRIDFKTPAIISLAVNVISGICGLLLAFGGWGVWALVYPSLLGTTIKIIVVWRISTWRPSMSFSVTSFKKMFGFGSNLVVNSILQSIYNQGTNLLIGKFYSPTALGFYSKGSGIASLPSVGINQILYSVTFPVFSKIQDDNEQLLHAYSRYISIVSMVSCFCMMLFIVLAKPLVVFIYSEKWEPAVIYVQLFALTYLLFHIHAVSWNLLLVKGRSDYALKREVINKTIRFAMLFAALPFGVIWVALSYVLGSVTDLFINTYYSKKVANLGFQQQMKDFVPYLVYSLFAVAPAYAITLLGLNNLLTIIIGGGLSVFIYLVVLKYRKDESLSALISLTPFQKGTK